MIVKQVWTKKKAGHKTYWQQAYSVMLRPGSRVKAFVYFLKIRFANTQNLILTLEL